MKLPPARKGWGEGHIHLAVGQKDAPSVTYVQPQRIP